MFTKHKVYYTVEVKQDDMSYLFICSFSTFNEAKDRMNELKTSTNREYRILKIEKDVEQIE